MSSFDIPGFILHLHHLGHEVEKEKRVALLKVGNLVRKELRSAIGTYRYNWAPLSPKTVARKKRGDTPLLETGEMRDSYGVNMVDANTVEVGSNNFKARKHEFGDSRVPPRPVLVPAAQAIEAEAVKIADDGIVKGLRLKS